MGHTPSQRPSDENPQRVQATVDDSSIADRVRRGLDSLVEGVRRRLSVFSDLDLTAAFRAEDKSVDIPGQRRTTTADEGALPVHRTEETALAVPARTVPFTQPAREADDENPPELESAEEEGHLSIYHPDHEGAEITSDTYHRVEP